MDVVGMVFGLLGFVFAMNAMNRVTRLEAQLQVAQAKAGDER